MPDKKPLPDSDATRDRRANERMVRWIGGLVAFLTISAVLLALLLSLGARG